MNLFIYGAGGTGRELLDIHYSTIKDKIDKKNIYFVDDNKAGSIIDGVKILDFMSTIHMGKYNNKYVIAIGEPITRNLLFNKIIINGFCGFNLIHKSTEISDSAVFGEGIVVYANSIISSNTNISNNVMIQFNTVIGHDVAINESSVVSSGVVIGGGVEVGKNTFIGMGVILKENIKIGSNSIIGMGSVVYNDIPSDVIALGNPARPMRPNTDKKVFK
jgi:sugar O-acyltransferase (sialic acid O-acetyltransferase NeuD family)